MNNYDIKCKVIEEELRSVWPEWHVFRSRDDAKKFLERGKCPRFMSVWMEYDGDIR